MRDQKARNKIRRGRPKKVRRCWDGGNKVMFKTEEDADAEVRFRSALHSDRKAPKRSYLCKLCQHWHITAMSEEDYQSLASE